MFTVAELTAAMKQSGRHFTPRRARKWWSVGILPTPDRKGLGRGKGTVSFWRDRRVLLQAQLAHDLLRKGARLRATAASLWVLGFPVPFEIVRTAIEDQIAVYYRCGGADVQGNGLAKSLWETVERFVRSGARARGGSRDDQEGHSLYDLTGQLLELFFGVGDGTPPPENARQWAADAAAELVTHLDLLAPPAAPSSWVDMAPSIKVKTAEEVATFVSRTISVRIQSTAVASARSYDWTRTRRLTRMVVGLLDRAFVVASPQEHRTNRALFGRLAAAWARLLLPVVLAVVQNPERYQIATKTMLAAAARIRRDARTRSMVMK